MSKSVSDLQVRLKRVFLNNEENQIKSENVPSAKPPGKKRKKPSRQGSGLSARSAFGMQEEEKEE